MSDRRFRAEQFLTAVAITAVAITAAGLAVGVGLLVREHRAVMARLAGRLNGHEVTS